MEAKSNTPVIDAVIDLLAALKEASFLIDEITDREGREGLTDFEFVEQVLALAHSKRDQIRAAIAKAEGR